MNDFRKLGCGIVWFADSPNNQHSPNNYLV